MQSKTPISICVIAKNEETHIDRFFLSIIKSMKDYPYEIVFVDTGSTDKTKELASKYTDNIFDFTWIHDFSAARNYSISCASNDWILVLDCDEYIINLDTKEFSQTADLFSNTIGIITCINHFPMNGLEGTSFGHLPRFFNRKYFHYENIIHEQLKPLNNNPFKRIMLSLTVDHNGYNGTLEELKEKVERNNTLLLKMLEEKPDPYIYYQLGQSYTCIHDDEKACYYFGKGLEFNIDPNLEYVKTMVIGYGYALLNLNRHEEALLFENIYDDFSSSADFVCLMGLIYLRCGFVAEALEQFSYATTFKTANVQGCNSYIPTYNMACIYEVLGEIDKAKLLYEKCGDFEPAKTRLTTLS